jgi:hypothetical protein
MFVRSVRRRCKSKNGNSVAIGSCLVLILSLSLGYGRIWDGLGMLAGDLLASPLAPPVAAAELPSSLIPQARPAILPDVPATQNPAASPTVSELRTIPVDSSVTYFQDNVVNAHVAYRGGLKTDVAGNLHFGYGSGTALHYAKYVQATGLWEDHLVDQRSKSEHRPSLIKTSQGLYLLTADYDKVSSYNGRWDSALYHLANTPGASWSKAATLYTDRGEEAAGPSNIVATLFDPLFADTSGNIHIQLNHAGWYSYGYAAYEQIYDVATQALGPEIVISNRASANPDPNRNCLVGRYIDSNNAINMVVKDHEGNEAFGARSSFPFGDWVRTGTQANG